jgi:siroheme synthase
VVPGVSSAVAGPAAAGIAVTRRSLASGVCIVTAHQDPDSPQIDWSALARSGCTLVVLMGARRAAAVRDALLAGGLAADTPVAIVTRATSPTQDEWHGTLDQLGRQPVAAPSVVVIGLAAAARVPLGDLLPAAAIPA